MLEENFWDFLEIWRHLQLLFLAKGLFVQGAVQQRIPKIHQEVPEVEGGGGGGQKCPWVMALCRTLSDLSADGSWAKLGPVPLVELVCRS